MSPLKHIRTILMPPMFFHYYWHKETCRSMRERVNLASPVSVSQGSLAWRGLTKDFKILRRIGTRGVVGAFNNASRNRASGIALACCGCRWKLAKWGRFYDSVDYGKDMGTSYIEEMGLTEPLSFLSITKYQCSICTAYASQRDTKPFLVLLMKAIFSFPLNELNTRQYNVYEI